MLADPPALETHIGVISVSQLASVKTGLALTLSPSAAGKQLAEAAINDDVNGRIHVVSLADPITGIGVIYLALAGSGLSQGKKVLLVNLDPNAEITRYFRSHYAGFIFEIRRIWDSLKSLWQALRTSETAA